MSARTILRPALAMTWQEATRRLASFRMGHSVARRDLSSLAVVGSLSRHNGIAQGARLQHYALLRAGKRAQLIDATAALRNPFARVAHQAASAYVIHSGAPETAMLLHAVLPEASRAWRVGYWAWELMEPPASWRRFENLVSEIWVPSNFAAAALGKFFTVPIKVVPHQVVPQPIRCRETSGPFTVLTMADSRSSFSRKNPLGAIEAFRRAFGRNSSARLVVKLGGASASMDEVLSKVRDLPNVEILTSFLNDSEMTSLYRASDVLLSLHRAEGFGLPMLEAMAHGVPVVGTGWSGNVDFMNNQNSAIVPFKLVSINDLSGIYSAGLWAEPDLDAAADHLKRLMYDGVYYSTLAVAANESVAKTELSLPL